MKTNSKQLVRGLIVAASLALLVALQAAPAVDGRWIPSGDQLDGRQGEIVINSQDEPVQVRPMDMLMAAYLAGAQDYGQLDGEVKERLKRLNPALPKPTLRFG